MNVKKTIKIFFFLSIFGIIAGIASIYAMYLYVKDELPSVEVLQDVEFQTPMRVYTSDGKLISQFGEKRRIPLTFEEIPQDLINTLLATEDNRFYEHIGVDFIGMFRAVFKVIASGQKTQGASTLTMQVARGFFLTRDKTYIRKIKEIFIAFHIEKELTKNQILTLYVNKVELGYRAFGFGAAAEVYYGKKIDELNIQQIAMLVGLLKAPTAYNPLRNKEKALFRRNTVLWRLKATEHLTESAYQTALKTPLSATFHGAEIEVDSPYIAEMVRQEMLELYGEQAYSKGFQVYTSVHSRHQLAAIEAVRQNLHNYDERHGYKGAIASLWQSPDNKPTQTEITQKLKDYPSFGWLETVAITATDPVQNTFTFLRANGDVGVVNWQNMLWARAFINDDQQGKAPDSVSDIVNVGDLVNIRVTESGWRLSQFPEASAALVSLSATTGAIQALVGGYDFRQSEFNRVTQAKRQVGSNIKPFIYSAALEHGFTLASLINDAPINQWDRRQGTVWRPQNSPPIYEGPTRMRVALAKSKNVISVRLLRAIGMNNLIDHLSQFGFPREDLSPNESIALGSASFTPLELATAYTAFTNQGIVSTPYLINEIKNLDGQIIYQKQIMSDCAPENCLDDAINQSEDAELNRAISPQNAFLIADAMKSTVWGGGSWKHKTAWNGTGWRAQSLKRKDIGGKTGTTNDAKDTWFSGYGGGLIVTSWVGFDDHERALGKTTPNANISGRQVFGKEFGALTALPAWIDYMAVALKETKPTPQLIPDNIVTVRIDEKTGKLTKQTGHAAKFEYFMTGTAPTQFVEVEPMPNVTTSAETGEVIELEEDEIF